MGEKGYKEQTKAQVLLDDLAKEAMFLDLVDSIPRERHAGKRRVREIIEKLPTEKRELLKELKGGYIEDDSCS